MNLGVFKHKIDVAAEIQMTPLKSLYASGDKDAHAFELLLFNGGEELDLSSAQVNGYFIRADGYTVLITGTTAKNTVSLTLSESCYAVVGQFSLAVKIKIGDKRKTVFAGYGYVARSTTDAIIDPGARIPSLDELLAQIDAAESAANAANSAAETANAAASEAKSKARLADNAATQANAGAVNASTAAKNADSAAHKLNGMTVSAKGLASGEAPTALFSDDGKKYNIEFGIPRGNTGATPQITVQVKTGEPGTAVSVKQTGTAEAPLIELTIPRGDMGSIGSLTINGKVPDAAGKVELAAGDINALGKDAQAKDSAKLGGKAPVYYIQPRNLLDNGNFTDPVNQRGQTTYEGGWSWSIDRWYLGHSAIGAGGTASMTLTSGGILIKNVKAAEEGYSYIQTRIAGQRIAEGKAYTFAYKRNGEIVIVALAADYIAGQVSQYGFLSLSIENSGVNEATFEWAALYEGTYSADTLPPYVAKEYAAEWMECRRYTQKITLGGVAKAAYIGCVVPLSPPMRIAPTITPDGGVKVTGGETVEIATGGASATADYIQMDATLKRNDVSGWRADYWLTAEL